MTDRAKAFSAPHCEALLQAIHAHHNILIGGGTGSGKTTFANAPLQVVAEEMSSLARHVGGGSRREPTPERQPPASGRK
jgi:hypothetical protein